MRCHPPDAAAIRLVHQFPDTNFSQRSSAVCRSCLLCVCTAHCNTRPGLRRWYQAVCRQDKAHMVHASLSVSAAKTIPQCLASGVLCPRDFQIVILKTLPAREKSLNMLMIVTTPMAVLTRLCTLGPDYWSRGFTKDKSSGCVRRAFYILICCGCEPMRLRLVDTRARSSMTACNIPLRERLAGVGGEGSTRSNRRSHFR